jgi:hypothetical protein
MYHTAGGFNQNDQSFISKQNYVSMLDCCFAGAVCKLKSTSGDQIYNLSSSSICYFFKFDAGEYLDICT